LNMDSWDLANKLLVDSSIASDYNFFLGRLGFSHLFCFACSNKGVYCQIPGSLKLIMHVVVTQ
jgi:hypothetical protein